jgi:hypothetical protein
MILMLVNKFDLGESCARLRSLFIVQKFRIKNVDL